MKPARSIILWRLPKIFIAIGANSAISFNIGMLTADIKRGLGIATSHRRYFTRDDFRRFYARGASFR